MAITVSFYNNFFEDVGRGRINLATDTFKAALVNGYTFNATNADLASVSNKLGTGNGYTAPGQALANVTFAFGAGKTKFDADDLTWTANGGSIGPFTGVVIYSDTSTSPTADRLVLYADFGGSSTVTDTKDLKVTLDSQGILTIQ